MTSGEIVTIHDKRYEVTSGGWVPLDEPEKVSPPSTLLSRRTSWTASDLLGATFDDPRFAVDGLIPEGLTFMCGAPKLGKSWLALGLSVAVAGGGHGARRDPCRAR